LTSYDSTTGRLVTPPETDDGGLAEPSSLSYDSTTGRLVTPPETDDGGLAESSSLSYDSTTGRLVTPPETDAPDDDDGVGDGARRQTSR